MAVMDALCEGLGGLLRDSGSRRAVNALGITRSQPYAKLCRHGLD